MRLLDFLQQVKFATSRGNEFEVVVEVAGELVPIKKVLPVVLDSEKYLMAMPEKSLVCVDQVPVAESGEHEDMLKELAEIHALKDLLKGPKSKALIACLKKHLGDYE